MENIFCLESHIHLCSRHTSAIPAYVIKTCVTWHAISGTRYWGFVSPKLHVSTYRNQQHCWWFQNGLIFRGERVIIPKSMRPTMINAIHKSHLGINSCLRRARECLFWPGMSSDIKIEVEKCSACREFETGQAKETLMSHEIPSRPWAKVGCDLLTLDGKEYLVTTDYFSNFWEIDSLGHSATAHKVIAKLKEQFARHGIPDTVVSDKGPQFDSDEFLNFTNQWDFEHVTNSPHHS